MYLHTKGSLVIDTHISDKFITQRLFLILVIFVKCFYKKRTERIFFFMQKSWREYFPLVTCVGKLGYHNVIIELDCKMDVDDVRNSKINFSEYGLIIQNCRTLLDQYNNFVVVFTRRQANGSAHALTQEVLSRASLSIFYVIPFILLICYYYYERNTLNLLASKIKRVRFLHFRNILW